MNRRDAFSDCHPAVNFLYYALVLVLSMSLMQPVCLAISLLCASWYLLRLQGWDALWQKLRWLLPVMALAAVMNPAFTHQGMTILTYLPSGNPLTLESILYGLAAAGLLASVILWFSSFSEVMTSDKFIYLFGRVAPALSLVLSMTLRFVPQFRAQLHTISEAQRTLGRDVSKRQRSHAPAHRPAHVLHPDYMESGDGDRDGGQHEKPRLRPARADELFDLSL